MSEETVVSGGAGPAAELAINSGKPVSADMISIVHVDVTDDDIEAAVGVLRSGMLAQGGKVAEFEGKFAEMTGAKHAVACANGTCALQLAYGALVDPGRETLLPAWGYVATGSMIVAGGATPVFCDADERTFCADTDDLVGRITPKAQALSITHLYGLPADIDEVDRIAAAHGLRVIYDAAQAHLATWNGQGLGAFGDAVTYSFYPTKNMTTGEGGMVTTNDDAIARELRLLRSHGETEKYLHTQIGFNYRMTDVEAAIGVSQLSRLGANTERRRANAKALDDAIAGIEGLDSPSVPKGAGHAYHQYAAKMNPDRLSCTRDEFCAALRSEGVATAIHYPMPLSRQPVFSPYIDQEYVVAEQLSERLFCLPVHHGLSEGQLKKIGTALAKVADAYQR